MKRRTGTERPPLPEWVLEAVGDGIEPATAWGREHGYTAVEVLRAIRAHRRRVQGEPA